MKHNKKITSLLKIMFKNSYDLSNYIDEETKKIIEYKKIYQIYKESRK